MALRFRFRWIPFLAALVAALIGIALGEWQRGRAQEKEAIAETLARRASLPPITLGPDSLRVEELEYRRVILHGKFVPGWNVFLENRPYAGVSGFYVLAPFQLSEGKAAVLVMRGWAPRDPADRSRVPAVPVPEGEIQIEGRVRRHVSRIMQLGEPAPLVPGAIVQNAQVDDFERAAAWDLLPYVVEQISDTGDELVRDWPSPDSGVDKHRGYAFQWYGLAAAALIFFFVTGLSRERREPK